MGHDPNKEGREMGRKGGWIAAVMLALLAGPARADIYAFTDASGIMHFSDVPDDSRYALFLRTPKPAGTGAATGATPAAAPLREHYRGYIDDAARTYQVEAALLRAVISAESGYDPRAVSPRGAMGLMQLMPDTARRYGVADPYDPAQSIRGGAQYLRDLLRLFGNDLKLALAAYNAGEKAVVRYGRRIPPYRETRAYVPRVLRYYRQFRAQM